MMLNLKKRIYVYNYRIFDLYDRRVASLAILADDRPNWKPDHFSYALLGCKAVSGIQQSNCLIIKTNGMNLKTM